MRYYGLRLVGGTAKVAPADSSRVASRYVLLDTLGSGGMGIVYRAKDEATGRNVAFKQLLSSLAGRKRRMFEAMFEREYHTLARLKHASAIDVYDYGITGAGPYYTMELLEGQDLQQLAPLPFRTACRHLRDITTLLALLHAQRLVHRDISPRNVRIASDGRAKLIDFGALHGFGTASEVVGTPSCMAPEVLHSMPLDQRADLYALGAVAYWALTGRHAFPARRLEELPDLWRRSPPQPSAWVAEIPPALDRLVMSLLGVDPLSRPASAALVIDQLTAIAGLEHEPIEQAALSYLMSGRMVGREIEQEWIRGRLKRCALGTGAKVLIEGPFGVGKTRLLHELSLQAQLEGVTVLKADAEATPEPFGVALALSMHLLGTRPEIALEAARPHADLLGHLSSGLRERLSARSLTDVPQSPGEQRSRLHAALYAWFLEVARGLPLALAVDNLQAVDDASAAFLAALGREAHQTQLILLCTQRTDAEVVAPVAVRALRRRSAHLKLAGLNVEACVDLVETLFGDVANTARVGRLLHEKSAGNPQQCMDLAQLLVKQRIARYAGGTWVLPLEVADGELPSRAEEILATRLGGLSGGALRVAETLSIHERPVSIDLCLLLAQGDDDARTHVMLDELVAEQIVLIEDGNVRFCQERLRRTVCERMDHALRREAHLRAANVLLTQAGESLVVPIEAAFHLLLGGEESRGAELVASMGRRFIGGTDSIKGTGVEEDFERIVRALRSALGVYEAQQRSAHEVGGVLLPLVALAFFSSDWRLATSHGERAIACGLEITGLARAEELRPWLGRPLALLVGLSGAALRFAWLRWRGLGYGLLEALSMFCVSATVVMGTLRLCVDTLGIERIRPLLKPLALFPQAELPSILHDYALDQARMISESFHEVRAHRERNLRRLRQRKIIATLGEARWKALYGGMLITHATVEAYRFGDAALELSEQAEQLGFRIYALAADNVRVMYHAFRGESEQVRHFRERMEPFAAAGNTTWQAEMALPISLLTADFLSADTIAARRTFEQIARRAEYVPWLAVYADAAQAAYLALRGQLLESIALFETILPLLQPRIGMCWLTTRAYFAATLNWAGQHARAKRVVEEALAHVRAEELGFVVLDLEPRRQLALAEAGLGQLDTAAALLDALLEQYGAEDNPLLIGLLHKARAEVALSKRDGQTFETHFCQMEGRFRGTNNPALISQSERLADSAVRARLRLPGPAPGAGAAFLSQRSDASLHWTQAEISAAADPFDYALHLLLERARAKVGYLYAFKNDALRLVAASSPHEPPRVLEEQLGRQAVHALHEAQDERRYGLLEARLTTPTAGSAAQRRSSHPAAGRTAPNGVVSQSQPAPRRSSPAAGASATVVEHADAAQTVIVDAVVPDVQTEAYRVTLLRMRRGPETVVVGGMILQVDARAASRLSAELLDAIAEALHARDTALTYPG